MNIWSLMCIYYCYKWEITDHSSANGTLLYEQVEKFCSLEMFLLYIVRVSGSSHIGKPVVVLNIRVCGTPSTAAIFPTDGMCVTELPAVLFSRSFLPQLNAKFCLKYVLFTH